jgi:anti-sigma factor RsiW
MMDQEVQLKLQAFVDGELPEAQALEIANLIARNREAASLAAELKNTRHALAGYEKGIQLPDSREFYWSKIQRRIEAEETRRPALQPVSWLARLRRLLAPAAAVAVVAIAGFIALRPAGVPSGAETSLSDPGAFTYRDFASGTTLVWLSYPAEDTLADEK